MTTENGTPDSYTEDCYSGTSARLLQMSPIASLILFLI